MLSKWAFNALLKILEEPPEHVKFILATTETHKVPETIISRCQRYDFKSIAKEELIARLKYISDKEWIRADSESLEYIANASAGWLRDAISLYEQLISDGEISYSELVKNLWLTDTETIHEIYQKLLTADLSAINDLHNIASEWKNLHKFYVSLLQYSKEQVFDSLWTQDVWDKIRIMNELNEALTRMKYSYDPEVTFVVMLSKILWVYQELETKVVEKEYEQKTTLAPQSIQIPKTPISETQVEQAEEISSEDFDDIFGDHEDPVKTVPVKKEVAQSSTGNFDSDTYIQTLRWLKVKWAIVIWLKQARSFNMTDEYLEIVLQNNFTLKALNTADNVLELIKWLEAMGIQEKTVKLS
jgi:DNA polymerase-3 subunit gamma/tau